MVRIDQTGFEPTPRQIKLVWDSIPEVGAVYYDLLYSLPMPAETITITLRLLMSVDAIEFTQIEVWRKKVIDVPLARKDAYHKLTAVDRLVLGVTGWT